MTKKENKQYVSFISKLPPEDLKEEKNLWESEMSDIQKKIGKCESLAAIQANAEALIDVVEKIREIEWLNYQIQHEV